MVGDEFKIMQLTDLHFAIQTDLSKAKSLVTASINRGTPNLIVLTGDTFFQADKKVVNEMLDFFDSFDIPFAYTFGNHDYQGEYDYYYISNRLMNLKNSLYIDYFDDNISGNANYYINLKMNGITKYRLFIIDSNNYVNKGIGFQYDGIHDDQLSHYESILENENKVTSFAYFHIPFIEYKYAYEEFEKSGFSNLVGRGENKEININYSVNKSDSFNRLKQLGTSGFFCGHDHKIDTDIVYKGAMLSYGVKSSNEIYHDKSMVGYKMLTLKTDGSSIADFDTISLFTSGNECL